MRVEGWNILIFIVWRQILLVETSLRRTSFRGPLWSTSPTLSAATNIGAEDLSSMTGQQLIKSVLYYVIPKLYSGSLWRPRIVWNNIPLTVTLNTFMTTSQSYLVNTYEDSKAISVICCVVQESTTCQLIQRAEHLWARLCPGRSGLILISSSGLGRERSSSTSVCWCWRLRWTLTNILI